MARSWPLLLPLALSLLGIFDHELWTPDEPRAAELGREFLDPGHGWAVPTLNREPFLEKPPLVYWTAALSMRIFGTHAWAARLPCILFAWGTLGFTWLLARSLYGEPAATGAVLILSTSAGFLQVGHHLESDAGLTCFVAGAAYFLYRALTGSARAYAAATAMAVGAFFSKGFIAFAFLGLLYGGWILSTRSWKELVRAKPWFSLPALGLPIALWLICLGLDHRGNFLRVFVVDNHWGRLVGTREAASLGHHQPITYYLVQLPVQFAPWILGLVLWRPAWKEPADRFLLLWLLPSLVLLTLSSTKRGIYLIPLLPPLAILTAREIVRRGKGPWILGSCVGLAAAFALAVALAMPAVDLHKSLRPACRALPLDLPIYALDPDETTRAVIPFYTGRYLQAVASPEEVKARPAALVVGPRSDPELRARARSLFPVVVFETPADRSHRLWVFRR